MALLLSGAIGLEREIRQKNAGIGTHILVGVGAALFMLVSKYGFTDVLEKGLIVLDPSRMAAQIVSGIGFLGAGLIFVRRDAVRGLTTAAAIWVTAAVGFISSNPLSSTELFRVKRPVRLLSEPYSRRPDDLVNRSSSQTARLRPPSR